MKHKSIAAAVLLAANFAAGSALACDDNDTACKALPQETQERLDRARNDFVEDAQQLEANWGLSAYEPNALPYYERFPNAGMLERVYLSSEQCFRGGGYSSSSLISNDLLMNAFNAVPNRTDYSEATLYQKGDLQKEVLLNDYLRNLFVARAKENVEKCNNMRHPSDYHWAIIQKRLATETPEIMVMPAYEKYEKTIKDTGLNGSNTFAFFESKREMIVLNIADDGTKKITVFGGSSEDLLKIEQDLAKKGIITERNAFLNLTGQYEQKENLFPAPLAPAP